jgi:hypothetical protein
MNVKLQLRRIQMRKSFKPSTAVEKSNNRKLTNAGHFSATYACQTTCPDSCVFRNSGCYAETGNTGYTTNRLNLSKERSHIKIAKIEAKQILSLSGQNPLRLHVVGDCKSDKAAKIVSEACHEYASRYGMPVYTYTHARRVKKESWGTVSVFRSCETVRQCQQAHIAGFASTLVVDKFKDTKKHYIGRGMYGIPCPVQTGRRVSCATCKLCFSADKLHSQNNVILFSVHGALKQKAVDALNGCS